MFAWGGGKKKKREGKRQRNKEWKSHVNANGLLGEKRMIIMVEAGYVPRGKRA